MTEVEFHVNVPDRLQYACRLLRKACRKGVRVAVTGRTVGPGLYDCLAILGREVSLARLDRALPSCA